MILAQAKQTIFHLMKIFVPLHERENIHYLIYITCTKIQIISKKKHWKMILAQAKQTNSTRKVLRGRLHHAKRMHCACCICHA